MHKVIDVLGEECLACEKCVQVCKNNVFEMVEKQGKIVSEVIDNSDCNGCFECVKFCSSNGKSIVIDLTDKSKIFDKENCDACEKCVQACSKDNIEIIEDNGKLFAKIIDINNCDCNNQCVLVCNSGIKDNKAEVLLKN